MTNRQLWKDGFRFGAFLGAAATVLLALAIELFRFLLTQSHP